MEMLPVLFAVAACVLVATAAFGKGRNPNVDVVPVADVEGSTAEQAELHAALLSWAVTLSGLPAPDRPPAVQRRPHAFFVGNACGGHECKVFGWFPPGETIYLDDRLEPRDSLLAASIVVHEMVHYLQYQAARRSSQNGGEFSCVRTIELERQAYGVQREFITRYGVYHPIGASMHKVGCDTAATAAAAVAPWFSLD